MSKAALEITPCRGRAVQSQGQIGRGDVAGRACLVLWRLNEDFGPGHCLFPPTSSEPSYQAPVVHSLAARPVPPHSRPAPQSQHWLAQSQARGAPGSTAEFPPGATPGPLSSSNHYWGCTGPDPPCRTALGMPRLPGVPKGLQELMLGKPQAEGRSLSSLGLCGQLNKPQPPQLERPCRMMLTF